MDPDWLAIERFKEGDPSAFDLIFQKYKETAVNLAYHFVRQREAAQDIAQDIFIKIYEKRVKADPKAKFSTWLYRVTVNASIDYIRRARFFGRSLDEKISPGEPGGQTLLENTADPKPSLAGEEAEKEELRLLIRQEIEKLPEKLRFPILLYQFEDLPYKEIAHILNITEKAVERRLYHAKEALRKKLSGYL